MTDSVQKLAQLFGLTLLYDTRNVKNKKPPQLMLPEMEIPIGEWNKFVLAPRFYHKRQGYCGPTPPINKETA